MPTYRFDYQDTSAQKIPITIGNMEKLIGKMKQLDTAAKVTAKSVSDSFNISASAINRAAEGVESRAGNAARVGASRWAPGDGGRWRPPGPPRTPNGPGFNPDFEGSAASAAAGVRPGFAHYLDRAANFAKTTTAAMAALAPVFYAAERAVQAVGHELIKGAKDFGEYEIAVTRVAQSMKDYNLFSQAALEGHKKFVAELSRKTTLSQPAILQTMAILAAGGIAGRQLDRSTSAVKDLASEFGQDPDAIARNLVAAKLGATDYLRRYKIVLPKGLDPEQKFERALSQIEQNFSGQATARAGTSQGQLENFQNRVADLRRELGGPFLVAIAAAAKQLTPFIIEMTHVAEINSGALAKDLSSIAVALAKLAEAATRTWGVFNNSRNTDPDYQYDPANPYGPKIYRPRPKDPSYGRSPDSFSISTLVDASVFAQSARNQAVTKYVADMQKAAKEADTIVMFAKAELEIRKKDAEIESFILGERKKAGLIGEAGVASGTALEAQGQALAQAQIAQQEADKARAELIQSALSPLNSAEGGPNMPRKRAFEWQQALKEGGPAADQAFEAMRTSELTGTKEVQAYAQAEENLRVAVEAVNQAQRLGVEQVKAAERADKERLILAQSAANITEGDALAAKQAADMAVEYGRGLASQVDLLNQAKTAETERTQRLMDQLEIQAEFDKSPAKARELEAQRNALLLQREATLAKINEEIRKEEAGLERLSRAREHQGRLYTINNDLAAGLRQNRVDAGSLDPTYAGLLNQRDSVNEAAAASSRAGANYYGLRNLGASAPELQAAWDAKIETQRQANAALQEFTDKLKQTTSVMGKLEFAGKLGGEARTAVSSAQTAFGGISPGVDKHLELLGNMLDRFNAMVTLIKTMNTILTLIEGWNAIQTSIMTVQVATPSVLGTDIASAAGGPVPMVPGSVRGADSVRALLMPDEHVWTAEEVHAAGGHQNVERLRKAVLKGHGGIKSYADASVRRMADGGPVTPVPYYASHGIASVSGSRGQVIEVNLDGKRMFSRYMGSMDAEKHVVNIVDNRRGRGGNG